MIFCPWLGEQNQQQHGDKYVNSKLYEYFCFLFWTQLIYDNIFGEKGLSQLLSMTHNIAISLFPENGCHARAMDTWHPYQQTYKEMYGERSHCSGMQDTDYHTCLAF